MLMVTIFALLSFGLLPLITKPTNITHNSAAHIDHISVSNKTNMKVVVKVMAGDRVKHITKAEPLKEKGCKREKCLPCQSGGGNCENNGAGYRVECLTCVLAGRESTYEGETGKNGYTRGLQHLDALRLEDEKNALWRHCQIAHDGLRAEFKMTVLRNYSGCLEGQVNEAVRITMFDGDIIMNSKSEGNQAPLVRVVPTNGLQEEQSGLLDATGGRGWARGRAGAGAGGGRRGRRGRGTRGQEVRNHGL